MIQSWPHQHPFTLFWAWPPLRSVGCGLLLAPRGYFSYGPSGIFSLSLQTLQQFTCWDKGGWIYYCFEITVIIIKLLLFFYLFVKHFVKTRALSIKIRIVIIIIGQNPAYNRCNIRWANLCFTHKGINEDNERNIYLLASSYTAEVPGAGN